MGDGTVYGWYRRGVPIQHTLLIGLALFIFGRVTSPQAQFERTLDSRGRPVPVRELELQRLAGGGGVGAGDGAGDASVQQGEQLRQRASVAESVYHESEGKARQQASAQKAPAVASSHVPPGREFVTHATGQSGNGWTTTVDFQVLSWEPHAVLYRNFASLAECEHVKQLASARLAPSSLALRKGETAAATANIRTSSGTFLSRKEDHGAGILERIERRIADVTHVHYTHGEPFNVLRYELGQKYDSHYDTFDPASYGTQPSQRIASFLLYLTDVEEGGETHFPLEGPGGLKRLAGIDYKSCNGGLHVKPRAGDALLFWNVHPNTTLDKYALHGGCPVTKGEKWVATKWIRDKSFEGHR